MPPTGEAITQHLAERLCWEAAPRDDTRLARRLDRKQAIDGIYRRDEGAVLDAFFHCRRELGVLELMAQVRGTMLARELVPYVRDVLRYRLKTPLGVEGIQALPPWLVRDEARMRSVGFNAQQVRHGVCQRGAATRQGPRKTGPLGPETLAHKMVRCNLRAREAWLHSRIRALAPAGGFEAKVPGIGDAPDPETTPRSAGCGQGSRKLKGEDQRGQGHEIEVTGYGWKLIVLLDARTKLPLAAKVVKIHAPATLGRRALVTQARSNLGGATRRRTVVFDRGGGDGSDLWGLDRHAITFVVPAKAHMAVTADARAQAAAAEEIIAGRRVHTVRPGQGHAAWMARWEAEVGGITGLTTADQDGTPEHGRQANRRDFHANPSNAVGVRTWQGKGDGPGGHTIVLTNARVDKPWRGFDDDDARRLLENCCITEAQQQWDLGHPPQKTARAVRVQVVCTWLLCALAPAYRQPCEREAMGAAPVGWQRWRRQLLEQTREKGMGFAQHCDGIFHVAEYSMPWGVKLKKRPPGVGTPQEILAHYGLATEGCALYSNFSLTIVIVSMGNHRRRRYPI